MLPLVLTANELAKQVSSLLVPEKEQNKLLVATKGKLKHCELHANILVQNSFLLKRWLPCFGIPDVLVEVQHCLLLLAVSYDTDTERSPTW